jgi:hypothetical protein
MEPFPKDIAPNLYKTVKFKNRTIHIELNNFNWFSNLNEN